MRNRFPRRTKLWLVAIISAASAVCGYWYFNPQHAPALLADYLPIAPSAETRLYRWRDAQGQWVASDRLPPPGIEYEIVDYRHDVNTLPAQAESK